MSTIISKLFALGPVSNAASVIIGNKWYIIGGIGCNDQTNQVFEINLDSFEVIKKEQNKEEDQKPEGIDSHTAILSEEEKQNKVLIYGGYIGSKKSSKLFEYTIDTCKWEEKVTKSKIKPQERSGHSAIFYQNCMYIFGGLGADFEVRNDLWKYDIAKEEWLEIIPSQGNESEIPRPRSGHSAIIFESAMYIFGGNLGPLQECNDFFFLDLKINRWAMIHPVEKPTNPAGDSTPISAVRNLRMRRKRNGDMTPTRHFVGVGKGDSNYDSPFSKASNNSPEGTHKFFRSTSVLQRSPLQELNSPKRISKAPEMFKEEDDESSSPIVTMMTNSVVMKATFSNKRRKVAFNGTEQQTQGIVLGSFPCGRDGHAAHLHNGKMFVFGGDRFQMAYNDLFSFNFN